MRAFQWGLASLWFLAFFALGDLAGALYSRGQTILEAPGLAAYGTNAPSGGGGGDTVFITSLSGAEAVGFNGKVGHRFKPTSAITITQLGRRVCSGNSQSHTLRLWDDDTTGSACGIELTTCSVSMSGQTVGTDVFGSITPTTLDPSHYYTVYSDESSGGDKYLDDSGTTATTSDATINASTYYDVSCHVSQNGVKSYGVNWQYH